MDTPEAPPKPWEKRGAASSGGSLTPLGPSSSDDGTPKPWEQASGNVATNLPASSAVTRNRPWETSTSGATNYLGNTYNSSRPLGGWNQSSYGSGSMYNRPGYSNSYGNSYGGQSYGGMNSYGGYGGMGSSYGGMGSSYGGLGGYGGSSYGMNGMSGMSSYGGYNSGYGNSMGSYGGYGPPSLGGPYAPQGGDEGPPQPPTAWQSMLHAIGGVVHFFGRISFLVDENAHAFHFFITALLQLLDRSKNNKSNELVIRPPGAPSGPSSAGNFPSKALPAPHAAPSSFDSAWGS